MKIFVTTKTGKKETKVVKIDKLHYVVYVKARPVGGKANKEIIESLADCFNIAPSRVFLMRGHRNKEKVVEVT